MASLPTWVKAVATLGGATLLSGYLAWWITVRVAASVDETRDLMRMHQASGSSMQESLDLIVELQRIQCVNGAKNLAERNDCLRAQGSRRQH